MHFESKTRAMIDDQPQCTTLLQQEIVDVNVRLNQAVTQQFSITSSGMALNFQRPA